MSHPFVDRSDAQRTTNVCVQTPEQPAAAGQPAAPEHPSRIAPKCCDCRHFFSGHPRDSLGGHPLAPVDPVYGGLISECATMRHPHPRIGICGVEGRHFEAAA